MPIYGLQPRRIANGRHSGRPLSSKSTVAETSRPLPHRIGRSAMPDEFDLSWSAAGRPARSPPASPQRKIGSRRDWSRAPVADTVLEHWNASTTEPLAFQEYVLVDEGQRSAVFPRVRFALDSPLEEGGFELVVPLLRKALPRCQPGIRTIIGAT